MMQPKLDKAALTDLALGRLKGSKLLFERVLKFRKELYGADHPQVALCLENMASLDLAEGQKGKALENLKQAKGILEKVLDEDHPSILRIQKRDALK